MDREESNLSLAEYKPFNYRVVNGSGNIHHQTTSGWLEIRLFYVRITPCAVNTVPEHLTLRNLRREIGVSLEINGFRVPSANTALVTLRRDRVDKESSEVTYVSTDNIRVTGAIEFEVIENEGDDREMILCGSLERIEPTWSNGSLDNGNTHTHHHHNHNNNGSKTGCCSSVPVILTKTIQVSPRRRGGSRHGMLHAIPEDEEEVDKEPLRDNGVLRQRKLPQHTAGEEADGYESEGKVVPSYYSEEMYYDEDGQLTWFNAGVRVGVGIGLGMCLGIGIGVGLLMRSYQATTRNFRRRFF
ncbi:unnamed protein product [Lactuca virosa]|uniref:Erythronate-4-phosphate dehydrogenase family protein n=1 Tax=Lactuca virosa TaxID=75947 RepID=A0AAU9LSE1_9ASTR|nr:unnamed protein product [Lactuca virosa]